MGQYTEHWAKYRRNSTRHTLQLLGALLCLPFIALLGYVLSPMTSLAIPVLCFLLLVWLVAIIRLALSASKVPCPRCTAVYSRGKYLSNCPKCGLRMMQEDP